MTHAHSLPTWMLNMQLGGTDLTFAEVRVLRCVARGLTLEQTARVLGVRRETVKSQVRSARGRLGAKNTTHAVVLAIVNDLI